MTTINLKDYYPWYLTNEYIEVSDEVAAELRLARLAEALTPSVSATTSRTIPSTVMTGSNTLPVCMSRPRRSCWSAWIVSAIFGTLSTPCRRSKVVVDAHLILGKSYREIARDEGVDKSAVRNSVLCGIEAMKKYLRKNL